MLSMTRKTDYALVALARLAEESRRGEGVVSARKIGEQAGIPVSLLMNILKELGRGGLVRASRGAAGGYWLAMPPADITVSRVIESIEGPVRLLPCCSEDETEACRDCRLVPRCPITESVRVLNGRINEYLDRVTLADLIEGHVATPEKDS
jgi:Rrf2 family protein